MGVFRSEEMECFQVMMPKAAAYQCVAALGELELVEMINCNPSPDKSFLKELELLDSLDQKLRKMVKDLKHMNMAAATPDEVPETPLPNELVNIGSHRRTSLNLFNKLYNEYQEISERCHTIMNKLTESVEKHRALLKGHQHMMEVEELQAKKSKLEGKLPSAHVPFTSRFTVQVGVLPTAKSNLIETLIWRQTQGNAFVKISPIEPLKRLGKIIEERKSIIVVAVQGIKTAKKIHKLCEAYNITLHYMSWKQFERAFIINRILRTIFELRGVLNEVNGHRRVLLEVTAENCKTWFIQIEKMKATYNVLNMTDRETLENHMMMMFWVPKSKADKVFRKMIDTCKAAGVGSPLPHKIIHYDTAPPTYIKTNKFTEAYQHIVDAYGIPSYRELNPMPYTVITFPFLFAIMFGDVGHGLIMAIFAVTLICFENRIQRHGITNEIQSIIFKGRYIILMMGLFSIWTGMIYNDYFAQSIFLHWSHWNVGNRHLEMVMNQEMVELSPKDDYLGYPFPLGFDAIWELAENDILFSNGMKMKMAIIIGIIQMTFGIMLNLINHIHFKNYLAIFTEFLPQIIFFSCIFVYLVFLFFFKWAVYDAAGAPNVSPECAPFILITFIKMMMFSYEENTDPKCSDEMYPHQRLIQKILLITALLCVPIMFFVEPIIEIVKLKRNKTERKYVEDEGVISIMVHQFIHTIEFCLGSVSYTASYLRLWALSLAHYQLSSVLWKMVLKMGAPGVGIPLGVIISMVSFVFFASFTIGILVVIEGLSAFLHALRLHWMEFQSKFYIGLGHYFSPFTFTPILKEAKIPQELYPPKG